MRSGGRSWLRDQAAGWRFKQTNVGCGNAVGTMLRRFGLRQAVLCRLPVSRLDLVAKPFRVSAASSRPKLGEKLLPRPPVACGTDFSQLTFCATATARPVAH